MTSTMSYNNDKVVMGEVEYPASDPASGAFFQSDYKKNGDLKIMLDGSKDSLKLEAMKRIIGMIAKGRDASDLFPAVVKNVVSKNIEVKKLVYVYLVRYAEEQQDLALLSISTFQRALKDPNQLIRASALRVLSSVRVAMIVPIVMLAIRDSACDMSPYVRKTAAHAIPKLYSLDPDQKEELVAIIDKLLSDKAPLVVGSAAMAFSEVCPDRISLIHKSYRKLCSLLADVDEWGQIALLNVLTVYARTCFPDPNAQGGSDSESESGSESGRASGGRVAGDLRLALRAAAPLLQSRNSGVVLAAAQLLHHCGPAREAGGAARALVRLLRGAPEVQSVALAALAALSAARPEVVGPFLKSLFVRESDATHAKLLKLQVLTNVATPASAHQVLRELHTYVTSSDKVFAGATIQAIGRLAISIHSETETCLNGLLQLLSSKDEWVVCEAVVVVKRVVGGGAARAAAAVARAASLLLADRLAGSARAAGVWLVAEHGAHLPRAAAVLAHLANTFADQEELVKLQVLSLAVKVCVRQEALRPVCRHVAEVARYDGSYDVRDRARLLRRALFPPRPSALRDHLATVFCPHKPEPTVCSAPEGAAALRLGSLSQYLRAPAAGYRPLPAAPAAPRAQADRDRRTPDRAPSPHRQPEDKSFYSEPGSSGSESSSSGSESSSSEESSDEEEDSSNEESKQVEEKNVNNYRASNSGTSDSDSDSSSDSSASSDSSGPHTPPRQRDKVSAGDSREVESVNKNEKSNLELLLELDDVASTLPTMMPTAPVMHSHGDRQPDRTLESHEGLPAVGARAAGRWAEAAGAVVWRGVGVAARFPRTPVLRARTLAAVELLLTNHSAHQVTDISVLDKPLSGSRWMWCGPGLSHLSPGGSASLSLGLHLADSIHPARLTLSASHGEVSIEIKPTAGELMRAVRCTPELFDRRLRTLRGVSECTKKANRLEDENAICQRVYETANVEAVPSSPGLLRFAGQLLCSEEVVLLSVKLEPDCALVTANCSNMAIASLLANDVAQAFSIPSPN